MAPTLTALSPGADQIVPQAINLDPEPLEGAVVGYEEISNRPPLGVGGLGVATRQRLTSAEASLHKPGEAHLPWRLNDGHPVVEASAASVISEATFYEDRHVHDHKPGPGRSRLPHDAGQLSVDERMAYGLERRQRPVILEHQCCQSSPIDPSVALHDI